jgi:hypothetical protein
MNGAKTPFLLAAAFSAVFMVCHLPASAGEPGSSSAVLLRFAPGPRGVGMGEACTAVTADAYSTWRNPAGLAVVEVPELAATHNASFQDVAHQYLAAAYPLRYGSTLGLNTTRLSVAPFQGYDAAGLKTTEVESSGMVLGAAWISHPWGAHELTLAMDHVLSNISPSSPED